ncbi:ABI gene family member 3 isoform X1 [Pelodiscus sinensis]|uniref:ABI gene family member 3 isoform X1 n=1 Tax=Pelodiscus sinensis TaxID=13735 RepID=UPI003F6B791E
MAERQQHEIPAARQVLRDNYSNLHRLADYCESNYLQATDKRRALEETMAYSTQSLASVAYQVSNLAGKVLQLLDLQASELRQVEASVCCLAQVVDMHKEKVSRREIGTLTVCKRPPPYQKIIYPTYQEPLEAYFRKPLNFSILDDVGHGIKDHSTQLGRTGTLTRKGTKSSSGAGAGTLGRNPRILEPIQVPVVPEGRLAAASSTAPSVSASASASLPATQPVPPPPPISAPPPLDTDTMPPPPPPPPVDMPAPPPSGLDTLLPDVPPPFPVPDFCTGADFLEPPPPPPPNGTEFEDFAPPPPPPPPGAEEPAWAPDSYLEKVVTLYPYVAQKANELAFPEGAVIYVTRKYSDGWCEGVTTEAEGFFPGNYVEPFCS